MAKLLLTVFVIVCIQNACFCAKRKQLEKRLAVVEGRQNDLSSNLREDIYDLGERLATIEAHINTNLVKPRHHEPGVAMGPSFSDTSLAREVHIIKHALADEKSRWRREASALDVTIEGIKQDVKNTVDTVEKQMGDVVQTVDTVEKQTGDVVQSIDTVEKQMGDVVQSIDTVEKQMGDVVQTVDKLSSSLNDLKTYVDNTIKTQGTELKRYVDRSIEAMKEDIIKALRDTVSNNLQTVAPITAHHLHTATMATTDAPSQTATVTTTQAPDQTTSVTKTSPVQPASCRELYHSGERQSGVYTIYPLPSNQSVQVYCDMDTDGGGWTVFQRRQDGSVDFNRPWADYASGFGNISGEFWLGNDLISSLTSQGPDELRIDLKDFKKHSAYAKYDTFKVSPSAGNYKLEVGGFSGDAGDSLGDLSGMAFSTWDRDNDRRSGGNCAERYGAWWYYACADSRLNGLYGRGHGGRGVVWRHWKDNGDPIMWTEMKFRATH